MEKFARFFEGLQQDLKAFVYWCIVFTIFRAAFIVIYQSQIEGLFTADVLQAMWLGFRLSLKTSGALMLVGVVFATLPHTFIKSWKASAIRYGWHAFALVLFSILFFARIPYYKIFNAAFDMMVLNGLYDDKYAILMTAIEEYQLLWRLPAAIVVGLVLAYLLKPILKTAVIKFTDVNHKKIVAIATLIFIPAFWVFVRFGGSFTYAGSINLVSAARLKSQLLNEAILDDGQAMYRVYYIKKRYAQITDINISVEELKANIKLAGGNPNAATVDEAFKYTVVKPKLAQQPTNIVLVVGESYGIWPFMLQFKELGLVEETTKMQNSANGFAIDTMLAGGHGTITSVNTILSGFPLTNIYENYQLNTYKNKYKTAIGNIMHKLGYKTIFWYGGFNSWQNIEKFTLAQGFDEFYSADDFKYEKANSWGCSDKVLFEQVDSYIAKQGNEKVFHMVLTSSNHPPFDIDVDKEGFKRSEVMTKIPDDIKHDNKTVTELGHMWYMDKLLGEFVHKTEAAIPKSLFVITGDHSERLEFAKEQDIKTRSAIPCVFYGAGINKEMFKGVHVGVHNQVAGTIAELIAPAGFEYSAMMPNMFATNEVYNHRLYANDNEIESLNKNVELNKKVDAMRKVAAWRILKGNELK